MSIIIGTVGVVVQGSVTRKYDSTEDQTTLDVTFEQAKELHDSLGTVLKFFTETGNKPDAAARDPRAWSAEDVPSSPSISSR